MKIVIICGGLEEGKDGVGDYSRILGRSLKKQDHQVLLIALNDKYISSETKWTKNENTYRFTKNNWKVKEAKIKEILRLFNPDLVSLQFVPYAFSEKGLPLQFSNFIKKNKSDYKWHMMFHELWIEDSRASSVKKFIIRESQKKIIKSILRYLNPIAITTSNDYYRKMLRRIGYTSEVYPIFSNLPASTKNDKFLKNEKYVSACFFGNIQKVDTALEKLSKLTKIVNEQFHRKLKIYHIGRSRSAFVNNLFASLKQLDGCEVKLMGFMPKNEAANLIHSCDFGLSNYPPLLFQKSGSIASMLYNQIPVILLDENPHSDLDLNLDEMKLFSQIENLESFIKQPKDFCSKYNQNRMLEYFNHLIS